MKSYLKFGTAKVYIYRQLALNCSAINTKLAIKNGISVKKRVCHISYNHDAFDDRIYWKELMALNEAGYDCTHICLGNDENEFLSAEGIKIIMIKSQKVSRNVWLRRLKYFLFKRSLLIKTILQKAKKEKASIYHYHDLQINALVKPLKKLPWKPIVIYDSHEAYHLLLMEGKKNNILKTLLVKAISKWEINNARYCNYIIATDDYTRTYFAKRIPSISSSIIHNYSYFINKTEYNSRKPYTFIYTGLMNKERGLFEMANLVLQLKDTFTGVKLLLVGSFENEQIEKEFKYFIDSKKLNDQIQIHRQVDFKFIQKYYNVSKIGLGLFHETPKYKTFIPIKLFEYMAFGLPVIFSNHGPASKIIEKENCGQLVEVESPDSIKKAAQLLLTNEPFFMKQSLNGKSAVMREYSWEKEKIKLINVYHQLLNV